MQDGTYLAMSHLSPHPGPSTAQEHQVINVPPPHSERRRGGPNGEPRRLVAALTRAFETGLAIEQRRSRGSSEDCSFCWVLGRVGVGERERAPGWKHWERLWVVVDRAAPAICAIQVMAHGGSRRHEAGLSAEFNHAIYLGWRGAT